MQYSNLFDKNSISDSRDIAWMVFRSIRYEQEIFIDGFREILICYLMYKYAYLRERNESVPSHRELLSKNALALNEDIIYSLKEFLTKEMLDNLIIRSRFFSHRDLGIAILSYEQHIKHFWGNSISLLYPGNSITELSERILQIQPSDSVADLHCWHGTFLSRAYLAQNKAKYIGFDKNINNKIISLIKSEIIGGNFEIKLCDIFRLDSEKNEIFNKIFCFHPLALNLDFSQSAQELKTKLELKFPSISKSRSSDWIYNALICEKLAPNGKAVTFMRPAELKGISSRRIRQFFIDKGLIESVILLPAGLVPQMNIPIVMVVFSHNNEGVKLVDATSICEGSNKRTPELTSNGINEILHALDSDTDYSKFVSKEDLINNQCILDLYRYKNDIQFKNAVPFESVILEIKRGADLRLNDREELFSDEETNCRYLPLTNINEGFVDYQNMPYLKKIDPKMGRYCIKDNSLVISRTGNPYQVAVVKIEEGQKILANGNLFCIELDTNKVVPYYIAAFFMSEVGKNLLKIISSGSSLPVLPVDELRKVKIPIPPLEEQQEIAQKSLALIDEIQILNKRISVAKEKLSYAFVGDN